MSLNIIATAPVRAARRPGGGKQRSGRQDPGEAAASHWRARRCQWSRPSPRCAAAAPPRAWSRAMRRAGDDACRSGSEARRLPCLCRTALCPRPHWPVGVGAAFPRTATTRPTGATRRPPAVMLLLSVRTECRVAPCSSSQRRRRTGRTPKLPGRAPAARQTRWPRSGKCSWRSRRFPGCAFTRFHPLLCPASQRRRAQTAAVGRRR